MRIYLKTTFDEIERLSKGTKFEGQRIQAFQEENTYAPVITLYMAVRLRFKFTWDKLYFESRKARQIRIAINKYYQ